MSDGVPVNVLRKVMGHEQALTTLDIYTHTPDDYAARVLAALDRLAAFSLPEAADGPHDDQEGDDDDPL